MPLNVICFNGGIINQAAVVLDLPESLFPEIKELRSKFEPARMSLPIEITLLGSSGSGPFEAGYKVEEIREKVKDAISSFFPVQLKFCSIKSFPLTKIFYVSLVEDDIIHEIHERLKEIDLKKVLISFPFTPHCTICDLSSYEGDLNIAAEEITSMEILKEPIIIESASIYDIDRKTNHIRKIETINFQQDARRNSE
jgi:2'-5' RNA ligase